MILRSKITIFDQLPKILIFGAHKNYFFENKGHGYILTDLSFKR